jgi:NAD(P)-dependent dehydrogenase (short-subunit alcohol dehydrogenase family)
VTGCLASKVVVVTGGGTGIGRAVAGRMVAEGAAVVIGGRRKDVGERAAAELRESGGRALFVATDVTVEADVARLVQTAVTEFGRLDGAFNNAGGVAATGPVHALTARDWHADLAQNRTSVFHSLKFQIPAIAAAGGGSIVNNASIGGVRGIAGMPGYTAAKHGVVGLSRSAALENAGRGVRVNALVTGNADTPLYRRAAWRARGWRSARTGAESHGQGRGAERTRLVRRVPAQRRGRVHHRRRPGDRRRRNGVLARGATPWNPPVAYGRNPASRHPRARCLPRGGKLCPAARRPRWRPRHRPRTRRTDAYA